MMARPEQATEATAIKIDLTESWHADWWARYFGVTGPELLAVILEVGPDFNAVGATLDQRAECQRSQQR